MSSGDAITDTDEERAALVVPQPQLVDLFGERAITQAAIKAAGYRKKIAAARIDMIENGTSPLHIMHAAALNAVELGDWATAFERAREMAPYVHPKLNAQYLGGPNAPGAGPGGVTISWQQPPEEP